MKHVSSTVDMDRLLEERSAELSKTQRHLIRDLIKMRKKHGLSQEEVAERMGVSQPAVATFERPGNNPTFNTLRRYAFAVEANLEFEVVDVCLEHSQWSPAGQSSVEVRSARPLTFSGGSWNRSLGTSGVL